MNRFCRLIPIRSHSTSTFRAADIVVKKIQHGKPKPVDSKSLVFGATYSDHMLTIKHNEGSGWEKPVIEPLQPLSIHPGAKVLHYATEVNDNK